MKKFKPVLILLACCLPFLAGAQADIYFINTQSGIERLAYGSTSREILVPGDEVKAQGIDLDLQGQKIYWTDWVAKKIQRSNLDGSQIEDLIVEGLDLPEGIAIDPEGRKMYWVDSGHKHIRRANLDGSESENLVQYQHVNLDGISLDTKNGKMYWSEWGDGAAIGKVKRANLDGSDIRELAVIPGALIKGIALDLELGKIYWTDCTGSKIQRANLDGSKREDVLNFTQGSPNAIALDTEHEKMYWTDQGLKKLFRANTDGTQIEELIKEELRSPQDLTLLVCTGVGQRSIGCSPAVTPAREQIVWRRSRVFPNPVSSRAVIEYTEGGRHHLHLSIRNAHGQVIRQQQTFGDQFEIFRPDFIPGLYYYTIQLSEGQYLSRGTFTVH